MSYPAADQSGYVPPTVAADSNTPLVDQKQTSEVAYPDYTNYSQQEAPQYTSYSAQQYAQPSPPQYGQNQHNSGYSQPPVQPHAYPPQNGYPAQGYPAQNGYPQQAPYPHQAGYPPQQHHQSYPPQQQYPYGAPSYPAQGGNQGPYVVPAFRKIMSEEFCNCFDDMAACCLSLFFPACLAGSNYETTGQGNCLIGCCCYPFCAGCYRSGVQRTLGVADSGCFLNCLIHMYLRPCALTQETRAIKNWYNSGRPAPAPHSIVM